MSPLEINNLMIGMLILSAILASLALLVQRRDCTKRCRALQCEGERRVPDLEVGEYSECSSQSVSSVEYDTFGSCSDHVM